MAFVPIVPKPGMVLAVHGSGVFGEAIRLGSELLDEPNMEAHIAVVDHQDKKGTWWCLEGRPGGVGWRDASAYLNNVYTISNQHQPITDNQRYWICFWMRKLINTGYDWDAIVGDGLRDLHLPVIPDPWAEKVGGNGEVSGHVVCSSAATFAYIKAQAAYPKYADMAHTEPSDWTQFIIENNYA